MKTLRTLPLVLMAAACASMADRLDPLNTLPADIALAVAVPGAVVLGDGDAELRIAFASGGELLEDTRLPLQVRAGLSDAQTPAIPGEQVYEAALSLEDAEALARAQTRIAALRAGGVDGDGTFAITVTGGCRTGAPLDALHVTTWLRTDPNVPYAPLTPRTDVLGMLHDAGRDLPPCGGA